MREKLVVLGAGGHATVIAEIVHQDDRYELLGFLEREGAPAGANSLGIPVIGSDRLLGACGATVFIVGVGSIGDASLRRRLFDAATTAGLRPITAVHPAAVLSRFADVGAGTAVMAGAVVNPATRIGRNVIVNTGAIIEHDCVVRDHAHVASGAILAANVVVGEAAHVGAGATVRQGVRIGDRAVIGAGAAVVRDVAAGITVVGVPARARKT